MTAEQTPRLIAIDWGTSRFRAYLAAESGEVLSEKASDEGMSHVQQGKFGQVLLARCGEWLEQYRDIPVLMAGMVGSRNGWKEVPYVHCPASQGDITAAVQRIEIAPGRAGGIVPGLIHHDAGVADVIRGEETKILGAETGDGVIVLPGTHCKWAMMAGGRVASFHSYMTGEFYGLLRHQSVLRLLAKEPDDRAGFAQGLASAQREGGLLNQAFEARTAVLDNQMRAEQVGPFLSGLLIAHEIIGAAKKSGAQRRLKVVAQGVLAQNYAEALTRFGFDAEVLSPRQCFVRGMLRLIPDWLK
jgi:2-dehydro-3-deoxygalactonokinase